MIRSGDSELRELGIAIFCENTNNYEDYWELRTGYDPANIFLEKPQQDCFNRLFNHIDKETVQVFLDKKKNDYNDSVMKTRVGRIDLIKRSCVIATKEQQSKQSKNKKR